MKVSVPSRGLSYLKELFEHYQKHWAEGFRPLTGTLLSKNKVYHCPHSVAQKFPSPHGDSLI